MEQFQVRVFAIEVEAGVGPILAHRGALFPGPELRGPRGSRERLLIGGDVEVVQPHDLIFSTNGVFTTTAPTGLPRISTSKALPSLASGVGR